MEMTEAEAESWRLATGEATRLIAQWTDND